MEILKADEKCIEVQKLGFAATRPGVKVNDFAPRNNPAVNKREDGVLYRNDVCYSDKYPNSHVDIWYENEDKMVKRPTIIYIHGGGFILGDKVAGDPLAVSTGRDVGFCAEVAKRGCNVIGVNYALAPEFRFPVQIEQVDLMLDYLTRHQEDLGLDMDRVFLGGGSAGAILSEIYGAVLCNPAYAKQLGIYPSIRREQIKGLLLDEAALNKSHFEENMNAMLGCWMGVDNLSEREEADILNAARWIEESYIPSFINASNQEPFFKDSADELAAVLEKIGTDYEYFYRGQDAGILEHGYMQQFKSNGIAKEYFEHMMAFIERQLGK